MTDPHDDDQDRYEPFMRLPPAVALLIVLLGLVGSSLLGDAFSTARNYSWSSAALIPLVQVVSLNAACLGVAATAGWLLRLRRLRRWQGAVEMSLLYAFAVAGWLLLDRFVRLFIAW
jgi:hypothetical protein